MPFVTEVLWGEFGFGAEGTLIRAAWPAPVAVPEAEAARAELDWVVGLIGAVRAVRSEMHVPPSILAPILLRDADAEALGRVARWMDAIRRLARASEVSPMSGEVPKGSAQAVLGGITIVLPLAELIDLSAERARLERERAKAQEEAAKVAAKLGNESFVARAKPEVVQENRDRLAAFQAESERLTAALARLQ
jgi:valyl-tRNA synthetase